MLVYRTFGDCNRRTAIASQQANNRLRDRARGPADQDGHKVRDMSLRGLFRMLWLPSEEGHARYRSAEHFTFEQSPPVCAILGGLGSHHHLVCADWHVLARHRGPAGNPYGYGNPSAAAGPGPAGMYGNYHNDQDPAAKERYVLHVSL